MERKEQYQMKEKEVVRLKVAERLIGGQMKVRQAAPILNISTRQAVRKAGMVKYRLSR